MKQKIFNIIEQKNLNHLPTKIFSIVILSLIILNVISTVLESFVTIYQAYQTQFALFEIFSITFFTIEYLLRLWTADLKYKSTNKMMSMIIFMFSFMGLIDLLVILPFYLPWIFKVDLRPLRILRLVRMLRILKINRYSNSLNVVGSVLKNKANEIFLTIFITMLLLIVSSTTMYYIEHELQPDKFPNIISSLWWAIATLTTVGYGDVYPVSGIGKILAGIIALLGIGIVALPTGIISSGFIEAINEKKEPERKKYCPYCGKKIEE